eukprot:Seg169.6 transcript_id=Seg169.6/GoldUCD/mRNA.D3Y31 product="hypothetical protein" protein_id=Seg169.6/GoldUCD/D3Y31
MAAAVGSAMADVEEAIGIQAQINVAGGLAVIGTNNNIILNNCMLQRPDEIVLDEHQRIIKLPQRDENFIGREDVLAMLRSDIEKASQLIVIHGGPCFGKSALSVNFAHQVKEQFQYTIWIDMREVAFDSQFDKVFQKICATILSELNIDISQIKEGERSVQLERRFRSYASQNQKTLILLDNADEFVSSDELHSDRSKALKHLLLMISKNAENHVKIVASSRGKANEISFPKVKNINLLKFSEEDSNIFLERTLDKSKMKHMGLLVEKCRGVPYILRILALALNEIIDEDEEAGFVTCVQEAPFEAAEGNYSYINKLFDISFQSLNKDDMDVVKALSVFPASFSFNLAKTLCDKLGIVMSKAMASIKRLRDKGIIDRSNENGESLHPFMKEYIQGKMCTSNEKRRYQMKLITVYIDYLFKTSQDSFSKEGGTKCILSFRRNGSILENLVYLLKFLWENPWKNSATEIRTTLERNFPEYFLLLRFLCYLVNEEEIGDLFKAFLKFFVDGSVSHTIKLCIDELGWQGESGQTTYQDDYESVMIERRILSKQVYAENTRQQPIYGLQLRLKALLEKCKDLPDAIVKAYYMMKTNKLLGQYHMTVGKREIGCQYFNESLAVSRDTFGDGFFTVDCYQRYAISLKVAGKIDEAKGVFREAYAIAERSEIHSEPKLSNVFMSWGLFLLECTGEKDEGLKLLKKACILQEKSWYFGRQTPKVMIIFGTHDLTKFKSEYKRLQRAGYISVTEFKEFHLPLAENFLRIGREERDRQKIEEGFIILQEAFELCSNDNHREKVEIVKIMVPILKTLINCDPTKFHNAYIKLHEAGFVSTERVLDFLLPLAEFLLFGTSNENDADKSEESLEGFRILKEAFELSCNKKAIGKVEKIQRIGGIVDVLKKLIEYDLSKFKNAYIRLNSCSCISLARVQDFLIPLADCLLHNGKEEGDNKKFEQGLTILQEAFNLCDNDIPSQAAKHCETMVHVLKKFIKFDLSKFKNAYLKLQESGFIGSERVSDVLVPVAECLLFHGRDEADNGKSKEGFRILNRAFDLCDSEGSQNIYHVLGVASKYDVLKLIDYVQKFKFTARYTSSTEFYEFAKFHSLPTKNMNNRPYERASVEQELTERMQFAKIIIRIMSGDDLKIISDEERESHFRNLCHLNKVFATESTHILTEDERRPFAEKCLLLKESYDNRLNKRDLQDLNHIVDNKTSKNDQQYYKEVCFLLRVRDRMIKRGLAEQLKQNVQTLKQHPWNKEPDIENKLAICLLAIPSVRESEEGLTLLEKLVVYIEKQQYLVKGDLYYLNLLMPKFVKSAAKKQRFGAYTCVEHFPHQNSYTTSPDRRNLDTFNLLPIALKNLLPGGTLKEKS